MGNIYILIQFYLLTFTENKMCVITTTQQNWLTFRGTIKLLGNDFDV